MCTANSNFTRLLLLRNARLVTAALFAFATPLVWADSLEDEVASLDLESIRDWVDVNRGILNDPRVDEATRVRLSTELQALRRRLEAIREDLGDTEVDRVNDMRIAHSLQDTNRLLGNDGLKGLRDTSPTFGNSVLPSKARMESQIDRLSKYGSDETVPIGNRRTALNQLEALLIRVRDEMLEANRGKDRIEVNRLVDAHRRLAGEISDLKRGLADKQGLDGGGGKQTDAVQTDPPKLSYDLGTAGAANSAAKLPGQEVEVKPPESQNQPPRRHHLDHLEPTPVPYGAPVIPEVTDREGSIHRVYTRHNDGITVEHVEHDDGSSTTIEATSSGHGEETTYTYRDSKGEVTYIERTEEDGGFSFLTREDYGPDGTRVVAEWVNGDYSTPPGRVTTTEADGLVHTQGMGVAGVILQTTTSPNGYESTWRRNADGSTTTVDRDSDGRVYRFANHSTDGVSTITEIDSDSNGAETGRRERIINRREN